ncbi:UNVERIFIED_CONTAM: hypothetical protein O8I53_11115 [Campylobacter lari]
MPSLVNVDLRILYKIKLNELMKQFLDPINQFNNLPYIKFATQVEIVNKISNKLKTNLGAPKIL